MSLISEYFNRRQEKRELDKRAGLIIEAIDSGNTAFVKKELLELENTEAALGRYYESFLLRAIEKDNAEVFSAMFDIIGNPDYIFSSHEGMIGGGIYHYSEESILGRAISMGSRNVALVLAKYPGVDIEKTGYTKTFRYHSGGFFGSSHQTNERSDYEKPLEAARNKGMDQVVAVLAKRTADMLREKARLLNDEARGLLPN